MAFDPVAWINTPRWQASRLGLDRMVDLLERLGRPQDDLRFVHVAGTNGKGSTCAYLASVLQAAGLRVGLFTSPFVYCFEERIRVNGVNISAEELARAVEVVRPVAEAMEAATGDHPTEFELMAAVALEHFRAAGCDIVVMEVGLGGRLDATNAIDAPEVSVICRIGLDHTDLLGDTLAAIAGEKAGIVKAGAPVVSWPQEPEAMAVIRAVADERGCALAAPDFAALAVGPLEGAAWGGATAAGEVAGEGAAATAAGEVAGTSTDGAFAGALTAVRRFTYRGEAFATRMLGRYQPANAAVAIEAVGVLRERGWAISEASLKEGIAAARWPGRFEVVGTSPLTIVDGGHNPQGAVALADSLADGLGPTGRGSVVFAMGVLADKDYPAMVAAVAPWARALVAYAPANPRALPADDLAACARDAGIEAEVAPDPAAALARARDRAGASGVAVAFGTLYAIADLRLEHL
ncbi:bifunctional folylpolyglutamate synthase/dihydrofolate synthase [Adlercreutzia mucosicola]|uniref:bifunctional folylpolyglutamate synthase/dihydrofolate synthase n=1 Tax=Adlercreutzia mucosicola TaxID=580026 RepID=UPI0004225E51|nr:folylpolyglutamate synthase/dihydrofolate synthase family protein [Adlercreutzia mucosicola]MCR2035278.1 bifunctional folylpolyglutamate synthase/dihydrofolate synthase [Adlercreutzia mucosicola]